MLQILLSALLLGPVFAQKSDLPSSKKSTNTAIFEPEEEQKKEQKFTAKVKVVREDSDGVEVFFEGAKNTGTHYLSRSRDQYRSYLLILEKSKKPQGPSVTVTIDSEKRITAVQDGQASEKPIKETWDMNVDAD